MNGTNRFFILRHDTDHPHYDLRLEFEENIKSWILPNRIPIKVNEKALAIEEKEEELKLNGSTNFLKDKYGTGNLELLDGGYFKIIERKSDRMVFEAKGDLFEGNFVFIVPSWGRSSKQRVWVLFKTN